jgi:hypothetical protein
MLITVQAIKCQKLEENIPQPQISISLYSQAIWENPKAEVNFPYLIKNNFKDV